MLIQFGMVYAGAAALGLGAAIALTGSPDCVVCVLAGCVTIYHGREVL